MAAFTSADVLPGHMDRAFKDRIATRERVLSWVGTCNWRAFHAAELDLDIVYQAAGEWRKTLRHVEKPWLVWCMHEEWSYIQQKLVTQAGWTPVVGYDPRHGVPKKLISGSILIDFNCYNLPVLYMHFPLEFVHLFAGRLAFWHSDLLCTHHQMAELSDLFTHLADGELAITNPQGSWIYKIRHRKVNRYFELAGCVTAGASAQMNKSGVGFWSDWAFHPHCPNRQEFLKRRKRYWDHGAGLLYWHKRCDGNVKTIKGELLEPGHFSRLAKKGYEVITPNDDRRNSGVDLAHNFELKAAAASIGLDVDTL